MGPDKNLTESQVVNEIYPVWTYSYLALLLPVLLLTDYVRYKPVLVLQAASLVATYALLLAARGVPAMRLVEFLYGLATAADVAYYSYIYSVVEPALYRRVTAYCRGAALAGSAAGSLAGQLMVSEGRVPLAYLTVATLAAAAVGFVAPWFLPVASGSLFFHRRGRGKGRRGRGRGGRGKGGVALMEEKKKERRKEKVPLGVDGPDVDVRVAVVVSRDGGGAAEERGAGLLDVSRALGRDFLQCYSSCALVSWSAWWALSTCGYFQVVNYTQALWEKVLPSADHQIYNGYVETASTLLGAMAAFAVSLVTISPWWSSWGEPCLGVFSAVIAAAVYVMDTAPNIWACYAAYVVFRATYMLLITIATYQVAVNLSLRRTRWCSGVNTFIALLLQSLLTLVVVDTVGLGLDIFTQFLIYAGYFAVIAGLFLVAGVYRAVRRCRGPGGGTESDSVEGEGELTPLSLHPHKTPPGTAQGGPP
ncbi:hypothetical protein AAFF_G00259460 [Aldrovandia affinis]|uniref:Thiamine transporter 1 n=1 Tax=Aldrovandia affinis TaxID=143900 RepID=A0AAD7REV2_9TELE|nr:hypothetical protein AAFF_G00259460 [Aldrovandia affinis]